MDDKFDVNLIFQLYSFEILKCFDYLILYFGDFTPVFSYFTAIFLIFLERGLIILGLIMVILQC